MKRLVYGNTNKGSLARNRNTTPEILRQLANDKDRHVRSDVADNPNTPPEILAQLANDEAWLVRCMVALNRNAPSEILAQLADDEDAFVRRDVAKNPNTPPEILRQLANDEDKRVRENVEDNPNTPPDLQNKQSQKWPNSDAWYSIEDDDELEEMWQEYLSGPEDSVDTKLQIFTEPSTQGGMGGMFLSDDSGQGRFETVEVDYQEWCDEEIEMAASSRTAAQYAKKYESYVRQLCGI